MENIPSNIAAQLIKLAADNPTLEFDGEAARYDDLGNLLGHVPYVSLTKIKRDLPGLLAKYSLGVRISSEISSDRQYLRGQVSIFDTQGNHSTLSTAWLPTESLTAPMEDSRNMLRAALGMAERMAVEQTFPMRFWAEDVESVPDTTTASGVKEMREKIEKKKKKGEPAKKAVAKSDLIPAEKVVNLANELRSHRKLSAFKRHLREKLGYDDLSKVPLEHLADVESMAQSLIGPQTH